jgi:hypothetical protein
MNDMKPKNNDKMIDLFKKYLQDIRNLKPIDKEMMNNIRNMSNEEKMDIIILLNENVINLKSFLE